MEKKVVDYTTAAASSFVGLTNEVRRAISDGWQPLGGMAATSIVRHQNSVEEEMFYQALVKYEP